MRHAVYHVVAKHARKLLPHATPIMVTILICLDGGNIDRYIWIFCAMMEGGHIISHYEEVQVHNNKVSNESTGSTL